MDLQKLLREEHSKTQSQRIADLVGESKPAFSRLVGIVTGDDLKLSQRGAWAVTCCVEAHPELLPPFLEALIKNLSRPGLHDAVKRNTMKVIAENEIPENLAGLAADTAFRILSSPDESIAARVHSMTVLERLCTMEPELSVELHLLIEHQLPFETSPGYRSKARRVLKTLDRLAKATRDPL